MTHPSPELLSKAAELLERYRDELMRFHYKGDGNWSSLWAEQTHSSAKYVAIELRRHTG